MKALRLPTAFLLTLTLSCPVIGAPPPVPAKKIEAARRFLDLIDQPQPRTYRQMLQMLKPLASSEVVEELESKLQDRLDDRFPLYRLENRGEFLDLKYGKGSTERTLTFYKKHPKIFATINGVEILHSEIGDGMKVLEKIRLGIDGKRSAKGVLFGEHAYAFDWALFGGLGLIGVGAAVGLYFLSRSKIKTESQVNVNVPTSYSVNVPTDYTVTTDNSIRVPQIDPYLPQTKGVK